MMEYGVVEEIIKCEAKGITSILHQDSKDYNFIIQKRITFEQLFFFKMH